VIRSFSDRKAEELFNDAFVKEFQGVARRAKRKLEVVHAAGRLQVDRQ
jgi:hypothetical protein